MEALPHHYRVRGSAAAGSNVALQADDLPEIVSAPPAEFGGPGTLWSPESLLIAAVADCFILTFRTIAEASRFEWIDINCEATGTLDREERSIHFTRLAITARLTVAAGSDTAKAEKLLHKAEASCLITNSLRAERELDVTVNVAS